MGAHASDWKQIIIWEMRRAIKHIGFSRERPVILINPVSVTGTSSRSAFESHQS
jgi:hypothetical protein